MQQMTQKAFILTLVFTSILFGQIITLDEFEKAVVTTGYQQQEDSLDNIARQWQKKNVIAGYLPDLTLNGSVLGLSKEAQEAQFGQGIPVHDTVMVTYDLTLNQPITNGGIEIVAIRIADISKQAQEIGYEINRDKALVSARKQYFSLLKLMEQVKLAKEDLSWDKEKLKEAQIRFEAKVLPETDLLMWKSTVLSKECSLNRLLLSQASHFANMKHLMGKEYVWGDSFELEPFEQFEEWYSSLVFAEINLGKSKIVHQMELYNEVTEKNTLVAITSALPKLNGFVTYKRSRYKDDDDYSGGLQGGLQLSVPIFNGLRNVTAYREKKFEAIKSKVELEKLKSELTVTAVELKSYCEASIETIKSIKKQHALNKKNVEIMNERYLLGQVSQSDLISMRNAVSLTRLEYVTTILDMLYYYTEYQNILGILEVK